MRNKTQRDDNFSRSQSLNAQGMMHRKTCISSIYLVLFRVTNELTNITRGTQLWKGAKMNTRLVTFRDAVLLLGCKI
jgi:hypothetical protein